MEFNETNLQNVYLENLDVDLMTFYSNVIQREVQPNDMSSNSMTLSRLRSEYANKLHSDDGCAISFEQVGVRCAYVFQFCPSFTLAIAQHLLAFVKNAPTQHVVNLAARDSLTLCCLGAGPGTEVVAICSVLVEVRRHCLPLQQDPLRLDATVVDIDPAWSTTSRNVINSLPELVGTGLVVDNVRFLQCDMAQATSPEVSRAVARSDLVTITKFLSALHGPRDLGTLSRILEDTTQNMADRSLLFLLDSSGWPNFEPATRIIHSFAWMEPVYGPLRMESRLSGASVSRCLTLFSAIYGHRSCTEKSVNKSAVSLKRGSRNL